jgi:glutamate synthase domain-containing protein 3
MMKEKTIDAAPGGKAMHYRELNERIRAAVREGFGHIIIKNVSGQRFIGAGMEEKATIEVYGDAGLDLGVFSEGLNIIVHGCSEYLLGNTLSGGEIVVYGDSWDITGMGARDGRIYVMGEGGSRVGIHMKTFKDKKAAIVYGGRVKQYCGEYMAGGTIIILGLDYSKAVLDRKKPIAKENIDPERIIEHEGEIVQSDLGAGIHGGAIYVRGEVPDELLGVYAVKGEFTEEDKESIRPLLVRYAELFNTPLKLLLGKKFTKIVPISSRPFEKMYTTTPI